MAEKKKTKVKVERMEDDGIEKIFDDLFNEDSYETEEDIDVFPEEKEEIEIEQDAKEDDDLGFPEVITPKDDKSDKADTPKAKKKDDKDIKIEELTDRLLRTVAEFDNYRKRTEKEKEARFDLGMKSMIERILPIVDNFERGLSLLSEEELEAPFASGMNMVYKQLAKTLEELDVKVIPAVGEQFDPNFHEAVMHMDSDEYGENEIVQEFQKGYTYKGMIIRYSMVQVAN